MGALCVPKDGRAGDGGRGFRCFRIDFCEIVIVLVVARVEKGAVGAGKDEDGAATGPG